MNKILPVKRLIPIIAKLKTKGKRIVFTNGCFDILHKGHVLYLRKAKSFGDLLVLGLNSDKSVRKIKGQNRPIVSQADRAVIMAGLESVDFVVLFDEATPLNLIKRVKPDILVKGADWKKNIVGSDFVKSYNGKVKLVNMVAGRSTSNLIKRIVGLYG